MKRTIAAVIATATLLASASALAKSPKSHFYDMRSILIDGKIAKPQTMYFEKRVRAKFGDLLRLKKSFNRALIRSSKSPILK